MPLNVVIADDDAKIRAELAAFLQDNLMNVIAEAQSGKQAKECVQLLRPDVLFIDIDMPDGDGFTVARKLRQLFPQLCIVFISVYTDFGSQSYDIEATDYLIKPFDEDRLYKCLMKIERAISARSEKQTATHLLGIKTRNGVELIDQKHIGFITADSKKSTIYLKVRNQWKSLQAHEQLKALEERVSDSFFFRSHRSFLININHIHAIYPSGQTYIVTFDGLQEVAYVSRNLITQLYKRINFYI